MTNNTSARKTARSLHLESLENREMLSVTPLGVDSIYGVSAAAAQAPQIQEAPPVAPAGLAVTASLFSATLTWTAPAEGILTGYTLEYKKETAAETEWTAAASPAVESTSASITGLSAGTSYQFRLRYTVEAEIEEDTQSGWTTVTATTLSAPEKPDNFRSIENTVNTVTLAWKGMTGIDGYVLQYQKQGDTAWTEVQDPVSTATQATVSGSGLDGLPLLSDTTYNFRLAAYRQDTLTKENAFSDWALVSAKTAVYTVNTDTLVLSETFKLHSYTGTDAAGKNPGDAGYALPQIYLDFTGHSIPNGTGGWRNVWNSSDIRTPVWSLDDSSQFSNTELATIQYV
ncbi:MAG: fibronectin type III domain-containing protein, partial [Planctomycetaceae bacterium]|nr:fibronectin type III domain-containing protein [Planctomycetaceae bacterium]